MDGNKLRPGYDPIQPLEQLGASLLIKGSREHSAAGRMTDVLRNGYLACHIPAKYRQNHRQIDEGSFPYLHRNGVWQTDV